MNRTLEGIVRKLKKTVGLRRRSIRDHVHPSLFYLYIKMLQTIFRRSFVAVEFLIHEEHTLCTYVPAASTRKYYVDTEHFTPW